MESDDKELKQKIRALNQITNLLFFFIVAFPFIHSIFRFGVVILKDIKNSQLGSVYISMFFALLSYVIGTWLYLSDAKFHFLRNNLQPFNAEDKSYVAIRQWMKAAGLKRISVFWYSSNRIEATAFGTRNHRYISISQKTLDTLSADELRVLALHESGHHAYGDTWKYSFSRYLLLAALSIQIIMGLLAIVTHILTGGSLSSALIMNLSFFMTIFTYTFVAMGVLLMARLRELLADNFALQHVSDQAIFLKLFARLSMERFQEAPKSSFRISVPKLFAYHPDGKERINAIFSPKLIFNQIYSLLVLSGVLVGSITASQGGDWGVALSLPVVGVSGATLLYYIVTQLGMEKHLGQFAFAYSASAALASLLQRFPWLLQFNYHGNFYLTTALKFQGDLYNILDNYLILMSLGSLYIIVIVFLSAKIKSGLTAIPYINKFVIFTMQMAFFLSVLYVSTNLFGDKFLIWTGN